MTPAYVSRRSRSPGQALLHVRWTSSSAARVRGLPADGRSASAVHRHQASALDRTARVFCRGPPLLSFVLAAVAQRASINTTSGAGAHCAVQ
ncbi:hypothetical protein BOTBODRAFT_216031 [Botryobasidium botryosum FD-172 SS1]|uniref:Uncharacterized protein n=1 Tax=Botryobasidium botryosum (strain FD-172 SS1) TaxID=930990 RepID=A0A067N226_BOTB1|nr:hypothetical protein BOTBODRAFT_216031 [Botryobasidium botryosum FD-172 SS1]